MINIHVKYHCDTKENRDSFWQDILPYGKKVEEEPGNHGYHYYFDTEDDTVLFLLEEWEDQASLELHFKSENMSAIGKIKEKHNISNAEFKKIIGDASNSL